MNPAPLPVQNAVKDVKLLLVGNKVDLEELRQVTTHRGQKVQAHGVLSIMCNIVCLFLHEAGKAV